MKRVLPPLRGERCQCISLLLPWPPQVNHYYTVFRGRKILSAAAREYHKEVAAYCMTEQVGHVAGQLKVQIVALQCDKRARDIDNLIKPILDSLQKAGVFENDSHVHDLSIKRQRDPEIMAVMVNVSEL